MPATYAEIEARILKYLGPARARTIEHDELDYLVRCEMRRQEGKTK